jgi:NAD(P)-dependent dehydrogenase (short-subunit alcohol dehydrogenase family)
LSLKRKIAVVTGSTKGISFAISKEYAEINVMAQQSFSVQGVFKNQRGGQERFSVSNLESQ